jgi:hypothetical protein
VNFEFNSDAVQPQADVVVETHKAPVAPSIDYTDRTGWSSDMIEFAATAKQATSQPRSGLFCILMLIQPRVWMAGLWGDDAEGWHDARNNIDLTFDTARKLIDLRIKELGLDAAKVNAYPKSHSTIAEMQAFDALDFDSRMAKFKLAKA